MINLLSFLIFLGTFASLFALSLIISGAYFGRTSYDMFPNLARFYDYFHFRNQLARQEPKQIHGSDI